MKQLILDTRFLIPTGEKKQPVVAKLTIQRVVFSLLTAVLYLSAAYLEWQLGSEEPSVSFWLLFVGFTLAGIVYLVTAFRAEHPEESAEYDDLVCLQQYALMIWKNRWKSLLSAAGLTLCLLAFYAWLLIIPGVTCFLLSLGVGHYFSRQIKLAARQTPDLGLKERVEVHYTITPTTRKLILASILTALLACAVALWMGFTHASQLAGDDFDPFWIWSILLIVLAVMQTVGGIWLLREPVMARDETEARQVIRSQWALQVIPIVANIAASVALIIAAQLI